MSSETAENDFGDVIEIEDEESCGCKMKKVVKSMRLLVVLWALAEIVAPRKVTDFTMNLATDEDGKLEDWVYKAARVEGVLILFWVASKEIKDRE